MKTKKEKFIKLVIVAVIIAALPLTLILIKQVQDNRSSAAAADELETEGGVLSSTGVSKQSDSSSSGGQYVQFSQSSSSTPTPTSSKPVPPAGNFIGPEVSGLPTSGAAWDALMSRSNQSAGSPSVSDQDDPDNVTVLAKALVYARTGDTAKRSQVVSALVAVQGSSIGRALALGRELGAYVLAADYIGYRDPAFVSWVSKMRTVSTSGGPSSLIKCHEDRPNNWGTHCGFSRMAADLYLGDTTDLNKAVAVFQGYLGDRSKYAGFSYGDLSWQCDSSNPVGINPPCTKSGHDLNGAIPDDMRRGSSFSWPPASTGYPWEAMQGVTMQAEILAQNGYPSWTWSNRAVCRASDFLASIGWDATGDDTWTPYLLDARCGTNRAGSGSSSPGKNYGFADWWAQ